MLLEIGVFTRISLLATELTTQAAAQQCMLLRKYLLQNALKIVHDITITTNVVGTEAEEEEEKEEDK